MSFDDNIDTTQSKRQSTDETIELTEEESLLMKNLAYVIAKEEVDRQENDTKVTPLKAPDFDFLLRKQRRKKSFVLVALMILIFALFTGALVISKFGYKIIDHETHTSFEKHPPEKIKVFDPYFDLLFREFGIPLAII